MSTPIDAFGTASVIDFTPRQILLFNGLGVTAVAFAALLPPAVVLYWLTIAPEDIRALLALTADVLPDISLGQRLTAAIVGLSTVIPLAWGLSRLRTCLSCFASGHPFATEGISGLRGFALGAMLAALAQLIGHTLMGLVLTMNAVPGHRQVIVRIDAEMLLLALFAGIVASLVWALERASLIAEENSQFV
jgi:hypothetical protein